MKKVIIGFVVVAVLLLLLLFLWRNGANNTTESLDMNAASMSLDAEMQDMIVLEDKELESIYGLDLSLMEDYIIKSNASRNGYIYALIKVDSKNKDEVKKQMNNLFDVLKTQSNLYSPEAVKILDQKVETTVGDYLVYISYKDTTKAYGLVKENIK